VDDSEEINKKEETEMITKVEVAEAVIEELGNQVALDLLTAEGYLKWISGQRLEEEDLAHLGLSK